MSSLFLREAPSNPSATMSNPKTDKHNGDVFPSDDQTNRKSSHSTSSRSDIFSRLVKLVGLSEYRGSKAPATRREGDRTEGLVVIGGEKAHSPVTVELATGGIPTSKGERTLRRSSSDSRLSVSVTSEDGKGPDLSLIFGPAQAFNFDGGRSKNDRKSIRRKPKHAPLTEPVTPLTPIPELSNAFERASLIPDLSCVNISNFADQDALMETDSIRARAAIAMARAQLEHSRPAIYNRKLERSSNQMMMLPGEAEEYVASQSSRGRGKLSAQLAAQTKNETNHRTTDQTREDDFGAMRKAVGQSQAMVLTLMAAKEAISQRASSRKNHHSPLASSSISDPSKPKRPSQPFQGLYRAGDIPPTPPPSIPLPQPPPMPPNENLDTKPTTPKRGTSLRNEVISSGSAYKGLPTEYSTEDDMLKHIDVLMQSLADSSSNRTPEMDRRRPYSSLPSRRGRRSNENFVIDNARHEHSRKPIETLSNSTSYLGLRHRDLNRSQSSRSRPTPSSIPPVPALPRLATTSTPSLLGVAAPVPQPHHGVRVENLSVTEMNDDGMLDQCNFTLSSYNDFGELTHTTRVSYPRSLSHKPSPPVPSGHTEKYFQQFTSSSTSRHPTLPRSMKLGQYVEPSAAMPSSGRGVSTLLNKTSVSSVNAPSCPPGIISQGFLSAPSKVLPARARTPEPRRSVRLY
ncbi:unnamed protein product [Rhizoctonia solani]|uniref:Uncharacterized protein n=1 Tax=Rhizoctonia solani TaxID=456999 RepID=A0A8H3D1E0_9AGAM|nr:unnamed protein product [Rhizoctonia solani]